MEEERKSTLAYCKGCGHFKLAGSTRICNYLEDVGHRRPCPPGEGCTEHTSRAGEAKKEPARAAPKKKVLDGFKPVPPKHRGKIDTEKALRMHGEGATDADLMKEFGVTRNGIQAWRQRHALQANRAKKGSYGLMKKDQEAGTPDAPTQEPAQESAEPATVSNALPVDEPAQETEVFTLEKLFDLILRCRRAGLGKARIRINGKDVEDIFNVNISNPNDGAVVDLTTERLTEI